MSVRNLDYFFHPGSVAIVGASNKPHSVGATVLKNTVQLPLIRDHGLQAYSSGNDDGDTVAGHKQSLQILIGDDNQDAATTLAALLQMLGHTTAVVHDGMQAVQRAKLFKPNHAILDIGMPVLNGYEAATKMRGPPGLEEIALVALTGWGSAEDRQRTKESDFDAHLIKPAGMVAFKQLLSNLEDKFHGRQ